MAGEGFREASVGDAVRVTVEAQESTRKEIWRVTAINGQTAFLKPPGVYRKVYPVSLQTVNLWLRAGHRVTGGTQPATNVSQSTVAPQEAPPG